MDADPQVQLRLLDLQALDSAVDRLAQRRRTLPELAELTARTQRLTELADSLHVAEAEHTTALREQTRLENEVENLRSRADRDQKRLDSGSISSSRELENLQAEIASLTRRRDALEDELLAQMEATEEAESGLGAAMRERAETESERDRLVTRRDAEWQAIDDESAAKQQERTVLAAELPADLITLYERLRTSSNGVGAARLHRRRCEGCHIELSGGDLTTVAEAPPDLVLRCEECRRILVRTEESGL